jgi:hypothetical protein
MIAVAHGLRDEGKALIGAVIELVRGFHSDRCYPHHEKIMADGLPSVGSRFGRVPWRHVDA